VVPLKVLFVSPEVEPFVKVGGLADMVGSLPKALAALGHDVRVVCPAYGSLRLDSAWHARPDPLGVDVGSEARWARTWETVLPGSKVPVYALEHFSPAPRSTPARGGIFPTTTSASPSSAAAR
jgi:starch synthase